MKPQGRDELAPSIRDSLNSLLGGSMERGHLWRSCFKLNLRMLEMNSAGITDEMAGHRPAEGVSSPAWIVGHLVYSRRSLITRLGGTLGDEPAWKDNYSRGGSGEVSHLGFAALCQAFSATDEPRPGWPVSRRACSAKAYALKMATRPWTKMRWAEERRH